MNGRENRELGSGNDSTFREGYYIRPRNREHRELPNAPPHIREIYDWLVKEANHKDGLVGDKLIGRGQCLRSYQDIQDGLAWYVGWRKHVYSKDHCETAMKWLKKHGLITAKKTTRGMIITIGNYDSFQNAGNYENHFETSRTTTREPQSRHTINKNEKNQKNDEYLSQFESFWNIYPARNGKKLERNKTFEQYCQLKREDLPAVNQATKNYASSEMVMKGIGIRDPKRFLIDGKGHEYWREWIEPEKHQENSQDSDGRIKEFGGLVL